MYKCMYGDWYIQQCSYSSVWDICWCQPYCKPSECLQLVNLHGYSTYHRQYKYWSQQWSNYWGKFAHCLSTKVQWQPWDHVGCPFLQRWGYLSMFARGNTLHPFVMLASDIWRGWIQGRQRNRFSHWFWESLCHIYCMVVPLLKGRSPMAWYSEIVLNSTQNVFPPMFSWTLLVF